jgi:imidazolonepropionase-like amidohydrolase
LIARSAACCVLLVGGAGRVDLRADEAGPPGMAWPQGRSFAVRAKAIYPVTLSHPGAVPGGMMIVRDGKIVAIGSELEVPPDLPLIELRDEVICPGFVAAAGSLAGRHGGADTISGLYDAADAFDIYARNPVALARGTTTMHIDPGGHRLVSGLGAIVKLAGPPAERILKRDADLAVNLGVFDPPPIVKPPFWASSDVPIEPARRQRPDSRLGMFLELEEQIAAIQAKPAGPAKLGFARPSYDADFVAFAEAWNDKLPLRVQVRRAADIERALAFVQRQSRPAYLVALTEGDKLAPELVASDLPLVLRVERGYRNPEPDLGGDPEQLQPNLRVAGKLAAAARARREQRGGTQRPIALAGMEGDPNEDLRMTAILAVRGGMPPEQALAAVTRVPAEIMGIAGRVGSLEPGCDADFLVLSDDPLEISSDVMRAFVGGRQEFAAPHGSALVVKAGTVWVGNGSVYDDGAVLIENGKVQAVGHRVPHPPFARVIDAGPEGFVTPGFIDAHGHLGLDRDNAVVGPDLPIHNVIGVARREFLRVARAGVTTILLAAYRTAQNGSRVAAIKTWGRTRDDMVVRDVTGVKFSLRNKDPLSEIEAIRRTLEAGKAYDEKWKKYEKELEEWKKGAAAPKPKTETETTAEGGKPDPITGKWDFTLSGGPIPEPVTGIMTLKLTGTTIEGRMSVPGEAEEATLTGRLNGDEVTLEIDQDTPVGKPTINARLDREDHMSGKVTIATFSIDFEATRTDKAAVEFRVQRRKTRTKDGRPTPPKVDDNLEPIRMLLNGKVSAVVEADTAAQIAAALKLFVDDFKCSVVFLGAGETAEAAEQLKAKKEQVGIVTLPQILQRRDRAPYNPAAEASRMGLRVALQSDAEDGARTLPLMGLFAVQQGLGGDAALRALTVDAAKMYKLDDRVGTLEPGKDGDVLIYSGHPFDADSRLERVIVNGQEVPDEE